MRLELLQQTHLISHVINHSDIKALTGSDRDLNKPEYLRLKLQFSAIKESNANYRFVYLMGRRDDRSIFFYVDNEPIGSEDEAPAGMIYHDAPDGFHQAFNSGAGIVEGPFTDRWGEFVSGCVPVVDESGKTIALLAIDYDAKIWKAGKAAKLSLPIAFIIVFLIFVLLALQRSNIELLKKNNEKKIAEEKLDIFKKALENSTDAIGMADAQGCHYYQNDAFDRLFGDVGQHPPDTLYCDKKVGEEVFRSIIDGGQWIGEVKMFAKDKSILDIYLRAFANKDEQGNIVSLVGIHTDITQHKRAENALRESDEKLQALFSSMNEMVVLHELVLDETGRPVNYRIIDCNKAFTAVTGIPREDAIGKLGTDLYNSDEPPYLEEFSRTAMTREPYVFETYYPPMKKHFSISLVSPALNKFATITSDISERIRTEQLLEIKNKELEQIIYVTSHDLRSPLVNIDGYSSELEHSLERLLKTAEPNDNPIEALKETIAMEFPDMASSLGFIHRSAKQMDRLLKGLLKFSRAGRQSLSLVRIDMDRLIDEVKSTLTFQAEQAGAKISLGRLPACKGDEVQVTQVFLNLIGNAIKFLKPDRPGHISVNGSEKSGRAVYCVEDNGIGIAPEHLGIIFEMFHRLDPSAGDGEGLGLTIVRQMLFRMDGEVWVESSFGEGSRFYVSLPAAGAKSND
ncbi:MAG: ATP-binding protein [Planctomycetota bacterium]